MSADIALTAQETPLSSEIMEQVLVHGDLARLSITDRLRWYLSRCEAIGLDPRTQPFQYITLNGKLTLYATRAVTDQIRQQRSVSVEEVRSAREGDCYVVTCRVRDGSGRTDVSTAAVSIKGLAGDALANALMKCETKAKRRATLSLCGLGMLDETELDTIPGAVVGPVATPAEKREAASNGSGYGHGKYAPPEVVEAYRTWVKTTLHVVDAKWADLLVNSGIERVAKEFEHVVNPFQLTNHLLKWCVAKELLKPLPESVDSQGEVRRDRASTEQAKGLVALAWWRDRAMVEAEAADYIASRWDEKWAKIDPDTMSQEEPGANG